MSMTITDSTRQEFLNAASHQNGDKLEAMLQDYGDSLSGSYGRVVHTRNKHRFSCEGNALHHVISGRIFARLFDEVEQQEGELDKRMVRCVKLLANHGCDVNAANGTGSRPLHHLIHPGARQADSDKVVECVEALLKRGADPLVFDDRGLSPLSSCQNAELKARLEQIFEEVHPGYRAEEKEITADLRTEFRLAEAIYRGYTEEVDTLLAKGITFRSNRPSAPLSVALMLGNKELFNKLVMAGADIHSRIECDVEGKKRAVGLLPFSWYMGQPRIFEFLLEKGLDPNEDLCQLDLGNLSPFSGVFWHSLPLFEDLTSLRSILATGVPLNFKTSSGFSILDFLRKPRSPEVEAECKKLLEEFRKNLERKGSTNQAAQGVRKVYEAFDVLEKTPSLEKAITQYHAKIKEARALGITKKGIRDLLWSGTENPLLDQQSSLSRNVWTKMNQWQNLLEHGPTPRHELARELLENYQKWTDPTDPSNPRLDLIAAMLEQHKEAIEKTTTVRTLCQSKVEFYLAVRQAPKHGDFERFESLILSHPMLESKVSSDEALNRAVRKKQWEFVEKMLKNKHSFFRFEVGELKYALRRATQADLPAVVALLQERIAKASP